MKQLSRKRIRKAEKWWNMKFGRKFLFPVYILIGDIYAGYFFKHFQWNREYKNSQKGA